MDTIADITGIDFSTDANDLAESIGKELDNES
jgi:hypothetical protein